MEANKKETLTKLLNVLGVEPDMQEIVNIILGGDLDEGKKETSAVKLKRVIEVLKKKEISNPRRIEAIAWELCSKFTDNPRLFAPIVTEALIPNTSYVVRALDEIIFWGGRTNDLGTESEVAHLRVDWDDIDPFRDISEKDREVIDVAEDLLDYDKNAEEKCNCPYCRMQARMAEEKKKSEEVKEEVKEEKPTTSPELLDLELAREMNQDKMRLKGNQHFTTAEEIIFDICKSYDLTTLHYDIFNLLLFSDEKPKDRIERSKSMVRNAIDNGLTFVGGGAKHLKDFDYKRLIVAPFQFFEFFEDAVSAHDLHEIEHAIEVHLEGEFETDNVLAICNVDNTFKSKMEFLNLCERSGDVYEDDCMYLVRQLGLTKYHYLVLDSLVSKRVRNTPIVERIKNAIAIMKEAYDKEIFSGSPSHPSTSEDECNELLWERHASVLDQLTAICFYDGDCKSWVDGISVLEGLAHDYSPEDMQWEDDNPDVDDED